MCEKSTVELLLSSSKTASLHNEFLIWKPSISKLVETKFKIVTCDACIELDVSVENFLILLF